MPRLAVALLALASVLAGCAGAPADAGEPLDRRDPLAGEPATDEVTTGWPDLAEADLRPGVALQAGDRACTSNFLFMHPRNTSLFLGTSAHCVRDLPIGGDVRVGDDARGFLIYSSWVTMQEVGEQDPHAKEYNDFAVILLSDEHRARVHPALPRYGGPVALADPADLAPGARVRTYAPLNATLPLPDWREGAVTGAAGDWAVLVQSLPPGAPGTLGGPVITEDGEALGVVVNVGVFPHPGTNGVARLDALMAYADQHARLRMTLATWDVLEPGVVVPS